MSPTLNKSFKRHLCDVVLVNISGESVIFCQENCCLTPRKTFDNNQIHARVRYSFKQYIYCYSLSSQHSQTSSVNNQHACRDQHTVWWHHIVVVRDQEVTCRGWRSPSPSWPRTSSSSRDKTSDPVDELAHAGVDARLVLLPAAVSPAHHANDVMGPVTFTHQRATRVALQVWG